MVLAVSQIAENDTIWIYHHQPHLVLDAHVQSACGDMSFCVKQLIREE